MPGAVSNTLKATGIAILAVVGGGIGGFLSQAYLEVWFDNVPDFKITDLATWPSIAKGFSAKFDVTRPQLYRAYYGENAGDPETTTKISTADFALRTFQITGKVIGSKTKDGKTYIISGHSNPDHLVLTQRSPFGGVGTYLLKNTRDNNNREFYFGYFFTEDFKKAGSDELWITQCPFVMMDQSVGIQSYPTADAAKSAFGFLRTKCIEFKLPASIFVELAS